MTHHLPVVATPDGHVVEDPDTGEAVRVEDASDHALALAAARLAELDREVFAAKRAIAAELRDRHGVGRTNTGGYQFDIKEQSSWPVGATTEALDRLVKEGHISGPDARRAMPDRPKPDARALKALAGRLAVSNPEAAAILAGACTVSPPAVRDIELAAIEIPPGDVLVGLERMAADRDATP